MSKDDVSPSEAARALGKLGAKKGGLARSEKLSPERRREIAKEAADARWGLPKAGYSGMLNVGGIEFECAVLEDGTRVIAEMKFMKAMGMYRSGALSTRRTAGPDGAQVPLFLAHKNLKPFADQHLGGVHFTPLKYRTASGGVAHGIPATALSKICEVWIDANRAGVLGKRQVQTAERAELLLRGFAQVGIVALVDEATGYQAVRSRHELHKILEAYIAKELLPWTKRFPDEFYRELFRLHGWDWDPVSVKRPILVGKRTKEIVYKKLPHGVLEELERKNPVVGKGRRKKHHQLLSEDVGNPHLEKHLAVCTALMRASNNWKGFKRLLDKAIPDPGPRQGELFDNEPLEELD